MADQNDPDYKDYQEYLDYQDYQKYVTKGSPTPQTPTSSSAGGTHSASNPVLPPPKEPIKFNAAAGAFGKSVAPSRPFTQEEGDQFQSAVKSALPYIGGAAAGMATGGLAAIPAAGMGAGAGSYLGSALDGSVGKDALKQAASDTIFKGVIPETLGVGTGYALKGMSKFLGPAAQRSQVLSKVKNIEELDPYVLEKVHNAQQGFIDKNIEPLMSQQKSLAQGQSLRVNPQQFMGHSAEADSMLKGIQGKAGAESMYGTPSEIDLPMSDALKMRRLLNEESKFRDNRIYDSTVTARKEGARAAGDQLRASISAHPEVGEEIANSSDQLKTKYDLMNEVLKQAGRDPVSTVTGNSLGKSSKLAQFDRAAGSNLSGLGKDIDTAVDRLGASRAGNIIGDKKQFMSAIARNTLGRSGRVYDATAEALAPFMGNTAQKTVPPALKNLYYILGSKYSQGQDE